MFDWVQQKISLIVVGALWPFYEFTVDGSSRYFWPYCLTGMLMAWYVHAQRQHQKTFGEMFLSREVWLGRSALNDYFILVMGSVLRVTVLSWAFVNRHSIAGGVTGLLHSLGVHGTVNGGPTLALGLFLTVTLFLVDDFQRWYVHYFMHKIPELWEFHKVHHTAEVLNFATAERFHPVEFTLGTFLGALHAGAVNGTFIALFGDQLTPQTVFGANVFLVAFNIFGGVLRHSPCWVSFGPRIERWIISPAMHQIHHSSAARHFDKNMGGSLSVWDRWFGTIYIPDGHEELSYGIGEETKDFRSLGVIYFRPFVNAYSILKRRFEPAPEQRPVAAKAEPSLEGGWQL